MRNWRPLIVPPDVAWNPTVKPDVAVALSVIGALAVIKLGSGSVSKVIVCVALAAVSDSVFSSEPAVFVARTTMANGEPDGAADRLPVIAPLEALIARPAGRFWAK